MQIKDEASKLKRFAEIEEKLGIKHTAYSFWKHGEYTDMLLGWKRKEWGSNFVVGVINKLTYFVGKYPKSND